MTDETTPAPVDTPVEPVAPTENLSPEEEQSALDKIDQILNEPSSDVKEDAVPDKPVEVPVSDTAPAKAPEAQAVFDERLLADAERVGISRYEALAFGSPKALDMAIDAVIRTARQFAPPPEQPPAEPEITLDPDEYDEKIIKLFSKIQKDNKTLRDELEQVKGTTQTIASHAEQEVMQAHFSQFDRDVEALGAPDVFGSGSYGEVTEDQFQARMALYHSAVALEQSYLNRGIASPKDLYTRAFRAEFGDVAATKKTNDLVQKVQKRNNQAIARPTGRSSGSTGPISEAEEVAEVAQIMRNMDLIR